MPPLPETDATLADSVLSGSAGGGLGDLAPVAALLDELRATIREPAFSPTAELAAVFRVGLPPGATPWPGRGRRGARRAAHRRLAAGVLAVGLLTSGVAAAGAADLLPGPAQRAAAAIVKAVTPFEIPSGAAPPAPPASSTIRPQAAAPASAVPSAPNTRASDPPQPGAAPFAGSSVATTVRLPPGGSPSPSPSSSPSPTTVAPHSIPSAGPAATAATAPTIVAPSPPTTPPLPAPTTVPTTVPIGLPLPGVERPPVG